MNSHKRHQIILDLINQNDAVQVTELVSMFGVSEVTIRRDLDILERKGLLRRVHGGAISGSGRSYEPPFISRSAKCSEEKQRIGKAAAEMIHNGDSIMLDVGTTTLEIARNIFDRQNLTVITPSFHIALALVEHPGIRLILTGGILRRGELSLVGHLAERTIEGFNVDKFFMGAGGIDPEVGFTEFNLEDTLVKQAMLKRAKEIIVVADSSKFGLIALNSIAPISVADRILTDMKAPVEMVEQIEQMGIEVLRV